MRFQTIIISVILILLALIACRDKGTEPYVKSIWLSAEDIGVTDASIHVILSNDNKPSNFSLKLNGNTILSANARDTLIFSDSLLPKHTYTYKAYRLNGTTVLDSSDALTITTMDTTSHNFTWEVDTLGDGNSSVLRDVAIVNDTCVWAVGELNVKDSLNNWRNPPYNIARWNGSKWTYETSSEQGFLYGALYAVFAFDPNDVWTGSTIPEHWNGQKWTFYGTARGFPTGFYINKIWGTSSSDLYVVGTGGNIVHFDGSSWEKLESGTDVNLTDVWGSPDGSVVWACGWEDFKPTVLLRLRNGLWEKAWEENHPFTQRDDTLSGAFTSVWLPNNRQLFALSWYGLYRCPTTTNGEGNRIPLPPTWSGFLWRLQGNDANDLFIVGEYYMVAHYNGMTFRHYQELHGYGRLHSVAQKENLVVAVGLSFDPIHRLGIVYIGRR